MTDVLDGKACCLDLSIMSPHIHPENQEIFDFKS
jgi:hypothetical protein